MGSEPKPWDKLVADLAGGTLSTSQALLATANVVMQLGDKLDGLERVITDNVRDLGRMDLRYEALQRARNHIGGLGLRQDGSRYGSGGMNDKDRIGEELRIAHFLLGGRPESDR